MAGPYWWSRSVIRKIRELHPSSQDSSWGAMLHAHGLHPSLPCLQPISSPLHLYPSAAAFPGARRSPPSPSQQGPLDPPIPSALAHQLMTSICRALGSRKSTSDSTARLRDLLGTWHPALVLLSNPHLLLSTTSPYQWHRRPPQWQVHSHGLSRIWLPVSSEGGGLWKTKLNQCS